MNLDRRDILTGLFALAFTTTVVGLPTPSVAAPSALEQVNTRTILMMIQEQINQAVQVHMFEFNDPTMRKLFVDYMSPLMDEYVNRRLIEDYTIVCDESNNTPDLIDRNGFRTDLYIRPTKAVNYIHLSAEVGRTPVSYENVLE